MSEFEGERIAKVIARAGLCSRRDAERLVGEGRVKLNGKVLTTAATNVTAKDVVLVDNLPLPQKEETRLWRYHKPAGLVVSNRDPEGRPTVFQKLREQLPRVLSIGRLDINTEGLLLLTNDGELARFLELPATGWIRRYRVRAFGHVEEAALAKLEKGVEIDGVRYGPVEAKIERVQGDNSWLTIAIREGKNREVKRICEHLGLQVNRLIRTGFGPFQLAELPRGGIEEVPTRAMKSSIGEKFFKKEDDAHRRRKAQRP
ncbi:pseudouridine synthase [Aestuariivirga sp.]|jgi:23S rRNA pseudouridine2605 synthase|uniref:pseudouridine synthase n=1 Tax=Aestuariivirga sp. TaxID=2650926 RepID=UPI0037836BAE